jgi:DNA mismatch repair protein MSH5
MLRNCTSRSLLIIDEFGKGTQVSAQYTHTHTNTHMHTQHGTDTHKNYRYHDAQSTDGVALLTGVISHLDARRSECPRTIVATHFHELTLMVRCKSETD